MTFSLKRLSIALSLAAVLTFSSRANASIVQLGSTFSATNANNPASSDHVSASVSFYYDNTNTTTEKTLIIDLVNQSATTQSADVLTGLVFNISGNPVYATAPAQHNLSPSLTLSGLGTTSTELGSGSFASSWTNKFTSGGNASLTGGYGISTSGFSGAFNGNGLTSEDHGIVGTGTNTSLGGLSAHLPLAENGLEFTLTFTSDINASTISNVQFLFGTAGTGIVTGHTTTPSVPEPASLALVSLGLGAALFLRRRFRRVA